MQIQTNIKLKSNTVTHNNIFDENGNFVMIVGYSEFVYSVYNKIYTQKFQAFSKPSTLDRNTNFSVIVCMQ